MPRPKSLQELQQEKMFADIAAMKKDNAIMLRLIAEIHAIIVLGKSTDLNTDAKIKKACDKLLRGNPVTMKVLTKTLKKGLHS